MPGLQHVGVVVDPWHLGHGTARHHSAIRLESEGPLTVWQCFAPLCVLAEGVCADGVLSDSNRLMANLAMTDAVVWTLVGAIMVGVRVGAGAPARLVHMHIHPLRITSLFFSQIGLILLG